MFSESYSDGSTTPKPNEQQQADVRKRPDGIKPDDIEKYENIMNMLLAAGYFRVRISTLTPFDKVIGGLCWCISNNDEDVDVDVTFEEESNIGQKIRISEQVIRALKRMKCPVKIQAHQIQGLDLQVVYEVLRWLVKKVLETRTENAERVKRFSHLIFSRNYELPQEAEDVKRYQQALPFLESVSRTYKPQRKMKRSNKFIPRNETVHVQSVLLEYGREMQFKADFEEADEEKRREQERELEMKKKELSKLKQELTSAASLPSKSAINLLVGMGVDDIKDQNEAYLRDKKKLEEEAQLHGSDKVRRYKQQIVVLEKKIRQSTEVYRKLKENYEKLKEDHDNKQKELEQITEKNQTLAEEIDKMKKILESDEGLIKLQKLVSLNEALLKQEQDFRTNCQRQLLELKDMIAKLQNAVKTVDTDGVSPEQIEQTYQKDMEKMKKIKIIAAKRNRDIAVLQRKIDEVPTRTELVQYEKRFTELYEQVEQKLADTRKAFAVYNTLRDTYEYMNKEMSLLSSIHESFLKIAQKKQTSKEYKQWLVDSIKKSVSAVVESKNIESDRLKKETEKRDALLQQYNKLVSEQRAYFKAVKEFQEEMQTNEKLVKTLKKLTGKE